ncbi:MAG: IS630 family transposase, partial [Chloroflexi bacterium]
MMMEKQGAPNETSHSSHTVRKRASLVADVHPRGQSQCSHLHSCPSLAQSRRRLDRPADLRRLGHQPQHLHPCATDVSRRRTGGRAARQAAAAPSASLDGWTGSPSHRHRVQSCAHRPRPLDRPLAGRQGRRTRLRRVHFAGNRPPLAKKNELKPWQHEQWCIPAVGAEFVAAMEDVLDLYEEEYDPRYPRVCFDEKLVAPEAEVRPREPMKPGQAERVDYEYERLGTANLFFFVDPARGWRHVEMTEHRTKIDYAHCIRWLVDAVYPQAQYIRIVQDNLNTHTAAALYEAFEPAEARRILQRVEFHYTPKHGSWLNMAEIEISIFARGCLSRRV